MVKLKIYNPIGDLTNEVELDSWTMIDSYISSHRFVLESSDGSIYDYTSKEWKKIPPYDVPDYSIFDGKK